MRRRGLGEWQDFNTRELETVGKIFLNMAAPEAMAAAQDAQDDGLDSETKKDLLAIVISTKSPKNVINILDYFDDPILLGRDLIRELEHAGYELVRKR